MKQLMDEIRLYIKAELWDPVTGFECSLQDGNYYLYFKSGIKPEDYVGDEVELVGWDLSKYTATTKFYIGYFNIKGVGGYGLCYGGDPLNAQSLGAEKPTIPTYARIRRKTWVELLRIYPMDGLKVNFIDRPYVRTLSGKLKAKDKVYNGIDSVDITFYNHSVGSPEYGGRGLGAFNELWRMWGTEEQVLVLVNPKAAYSHASGDAYNVYTHFEPEVIEDRSPYTDAFNIDYDTYFPYYIGVVNSLPQDLIVAGWQSNGPFTISIGVDTFGTSVNNDIFDRYISYNPASSPFQPGANMVMIDKWE